MAEDRETVSESTGDAETGANGRTAGRGRIRPILIGLAIVALILLVLWFVHYETRG